MALGPATKAPASAQTDMRIVFPPCVLLITITVSQLVIIFSSGGWGLVVPSHFCLLSVSFVILFFLQTFFFSSIHTLCKDLTNNALISDLIYVYELRIQYNWKPHGLNLVIEQKKNYIFPFKLVDFLLHL